MEKSNKPDLWVETKNTKVSFFEKKFRLEILRYLCEWLKLPEERRFSFSLFTNDLAKKNETKKITTNNAIDQNIIDWFNNRNDLGLSPECDDILLSADIKDIINFMRSISINIVNGYELDIIVRKRERELNNLP